MNFTILLSLSFCALEHVLQVKVTWNEVEEKDVNGLFEHQLVAQPNIVTTLTI